MAAARRQEVLDALAVQRDGTLAAFFTAHGLGDAYESPGKGWGREKKIAAALAGARQLGVEESVLKAAAARFTQRPMRRAEPTQVPEVPDATPDSGSELVFVSHLGSEKDLALRLKELISEALPSSEVFVSSDPGSIAPGERWVDRITDALRRCSAQIVVASPASVGRPWINFEAGAQWIRPIPVIPLCHSGMTPSVLPLPLSLLQAGTLTSETDLATAIAAIGRATGTGVASADYEAAAHDLMAIEDRLVAAGISTLATPAEQANRSIPELRSLSPDRRALERDFYDRVLELQTLRAEGLRPLSSQRLSAVLQLIGRFWTEPESMSDSEVANGREEVAALIEEMRSSGGEDLEQSILRAFYRHDLDQASTTAIEPLNVEALAADLGVSLEAVRRRIRELAAAGLVEPYMQAFGETTEDGHARITEMGRQEIEDQG